MADVNRGNRPLSPHLQIYRLPLTAITSILTRITGIGLIVGVLMVVWWLLAAATSASYFEMIDGIWTSPFGWLVQLGSLWALWYHALAGVRHLYWDSGRGLDVETADRLAWGSLGAATVLAVLSFIVL